MLLLLLELEHGLDKIKVQKTAAAAKAKRVVAEDEGSATQAKKHKGNESALIVQQKEELQLACKLNDERQRQMELYQMASRDRIRLENEEAEARLRRETMFFDNAINGKHVMAAVELELALKHKEALAAADAKIARTVLETARKNKEEEERLAAKTKQAAERSKTRALQRAKKTQQAKEAAESVRLEKETKAKLEREKQMQEFEDEKHARALAREKERHVHELAITAERRNFLKDTNAEVAGITTWAYFKKNKANYGDVKQAEQHKFVCQVGVKASALYREKWGREPELIKERGYEVASFACSDEGVVKQAFTDVYRAHTAGNKQRRLSFGKPSGA
jgi:hypothetical protein